MDPSVTRQLNDKLYDKRKQGALELERIVREAVAEKDYERIRKIVDNLCHDYAYAVHQPHTRNGGLIGLAATSIALGSEEVAQYLPEIVPPVLACFTDQDARVRYYACESMYNIAKVAKGEILLFFNDIFDALCKLAADSELSVKNGAELLDRLVKDIVAESAASYVSVLQISEKATSLDSSLLEVEERELGNLPTAFSLAKFIPLLKERINVLSPFTRTFLVSWLTLLDTIPDLELVHYLPDFLAGLFKFLSDPNRDVQVATQGVMERFLNEIKKIARIKKGIEEKQKSSSAGRKSSSTDGAGSDDGSAHTVVSDEAEDNAVTESGSGSGSGDEDGADSHDGDWVPGQDVHVDHAKILEILVTFVDTSLAGDIMLTALRWIDSFFEISPEDILQFVPRLLSKVLPAMASNQEQVCQAANRVNSSLMTYIMSMPDEVQPRQGKMEPPTRSSTSAMKASDSKDRRAPTPTNKQSLESSAELKRSETSASTAAGQTSTTSPQDQSSVTQPESDLDYGAAVEALTLLFLNTHETTRVTALRWLIMLHTKAPRRVAAFNDGTFPALLSMLSDSAEAVVIRDLQLLSQISRNSDDNYFTDFMENLLQLFSTDKKLLELRGNLIIRQLCVNLSPERIYRTLADCLEKDEDIEFASIMVQNLNNNLITAPELSDLRKRLRSQERPQDGQTFFVALFRSWCHNAVASFSLCLLAQNYEQAYYLLQIIAELEMTVNMLIQIDKLVQLLESPVFTYLRLQLLEPERFPFLYKCLYGLLMLLPQSSAFAALKNRLNSVSNIGLLHTERRSYVSASPIHSSHLAHLHHPPPLISTSSSPIVPSSSLTTSPTAMISSSPSTQSLTSRHHTRKRSTEPQAHTPTQHVGHPLSSSSTSIPQSSTPYDRQSGGRLKSRDDGSAAGIRWGDLLEKFRITQERARKAVRQGQGGFDEGGLQSASAGIMFPGGSGPGGGFGLGDRGPGAREKALPDVPNRGLAGSGGNSRPGSTEPPKYGYPAAGAHGQGQTAAGSGQQGHARSKSSLGNFGRLTGSIGHRKSKR